MARRERIVIDVSNLTTRRDKWTRTGVQEVVYRTLLAMVAVKHEFPDYEFIFLPKLPERTGRNLELPVRTNFNPEFVLQEVEESLRIPSKEIWGFDLAHKCGYALTDIEATEIMFSADLIHFQAVIDIGSLLEPLTLIKQSLAHSASMTVYDLIPVFFPEYCDDEMASWFVSDYVAGIRKYAHHTVCISRQTAIDVASHLGSGDNGTRKISYLPLPFDFPLLHEADPTVTARFNLNQQEYLVYLGSVEPRKNLGGLVDGFELFKTLHPDSPLKLAIVGGSGWKNAQIFSRMQESRFRNDFVFTGYLSDQEVTSILRDSLAVSMLSFYEGYGLPIAQGYSLGVQTITTIGSSLPEACGGLGIFVDPLDPHSVAAGISGALKNLQRGKAARSPTEWTWENYARRLVDSILTNRYHDAA